MIAVANGGTNDESNLATSCEDCNRGKGVKLLKKMPPADALRISQEHREQLAQAKLARQASKKRDELRQALCNFWCEQAGVDSMRKSTVTSLYNLAIEHGAVSVFEWVELAHQKLGAAHETNRIKYVYGIRRRLREEGKLE